MGQDYPLSPVATKVAAAKAKKNDPTKATLVQPVRTDSPRQTIKTFQRLTGELEVALLAYRRFRNRLNFERIRILEPQFMELLDLTQVPKASRQEVGVDTTVFLLDILGRVELPALDEIPDAAAFDNTKQSHWRIPGTPLKIVRIADGAREGEFLFGARTVDVAPVFYKRISYLPLRSDIGLTSWYEELLQGAGPMIPVELMRAVPESLTGVWLDTPIWKVSLVLCLTLVAIVLLILWHKVLRIYKPKNRALRFLRRSMTPIVVIAVVLGLQDFVSYQIDITGRFASIYDSSITVVAYISAVVVLWLLLAMVSEWIIQSPQIRDDSLDANLLRLGARIVSFFGALLLLAIAGQDLGLPVFSILAGLGIGGLAVALAIRPTLENLISGVILYLDRPVKVGDLCSFGNQTGRIEHIGMRATRIRTLDRTLISVPNSVFADKEIENWAHCDKMQIRTVIGLRYETEPDQLRYVLTKLREMFLAHPRIDPDSVRVRFIAYGASSLDVEIRVYALTREWDDFFAIREDVLMRASDIVRDAGSGFAFPSQTLYMRRDDGLDVGRGSKAVADVVNWRRSGTLPFPQMPHARADELKGTLDYPPFGSPDAKRDEVPRSSYAERLSDAMDIGESASAVETIAHSISGSRKRPRIDANGKAAKLDQPSDYLGARTRK